MSLRLFPSSIDANGKRLLTGKAIRSIADGYVSILLPAYLLQLRLSAFQVGALITTTLLGSAALTILTGIITARFGHRRCFIAASGLMVATGLAFSSLHAFWPLMLVAFIGTLNPSSGDVSIFLPLDHSLLSQSVDDRDRTTVFAQYSLAGSLLGAVGTLLAGTPQFVVARLGATPLHAMQAMFWLYALIGICAGAIYHGIVEPPRASAATAPQSLGQSRRIVYRLAALFSVDAFGGGFFVQAILALWLFKRFHMSVGAAATLFFWTNLLMAASYLAAAPIARRIGLIRTMVFTHLPSSLCLIAIPFVTGLPAVMALLLVRSLLSQMDVPTRSSYVMAVVTPPERAAAAGVTSVPRSLASAVSPTISGYLLSLSTFGSPLLIGGILKIAYDLTLLMMFRHIRPPEEAALTAKRSPPQIS
jgi:MFS family permease